MLELDVRRISIVFALSPARPGMPVGSDITFFKSLTMAKASVFRPAGLVTLEEKVSQSEMWMLKSQKTMIQSVEIVM